MIIATALVAAVLCVVGVSALADRYRLPAPLLLVAVGLGASLIPALGGFEVSPELILIGVLPPLLYSASYNTSFVDLRANRRSIASLSVGLVIFTTAVVGITVAVLIPGLPLAAGFAIGAVVAPPDAVAATAIARRVGMPTRIVQVLEGESLVNDATALTALRAALAALAGSLTVLEVGWDFLIAAGGGVLIGALVAAVYLPIRRRISNAYFDTALSFTVPYLAYLPAEHVHASGVIAVVVAGVIVGQQAPLVQSGTARITTEENWRTLAFLLENGVFLLIGLQLPAVTRGIQRSDLSIGEIALICVAVFGACVLARAVWVFGGSLLRRGFGKSPDWRESTVIAWAGMRGVVTLAAAFILPTSTPERDVLVLIAFVVVIASLLLQGATLPWLVRKLRLPPPDWAALALQEAALGDRAAGAGQAELEHLSNSETPEQVLERLRTTSEDSRNAAWERIAVRSSTETPIEAYTRLRLEMLRAERMEVLAARDEGGYDDEVIKGLIRRLDVEESMLAVPDPGERFTTGDLDAPTGIAGRCVHLLAAADLPVPTTVECDGCLAEGTTWVHVRMCLTCGYRGCCDSSARRHATGHFHASGHPTMRSIEPSESWRWCFVDELLGAAPDGT